MEDHFTSEQELPLYLQMKSSTAPDAVLLKKLFSFEIEGLLQAVMIHGLTKDPDLFFPASFGKIVRLSNGNRLFYLINTEQDESADLFRLLGENEAFFERASLSRCYALPVSFQKIVAEAENNLLDAFVYPEDKIFPYRSPNYDVIEQRECFITELFLSKQFQQIQKIVGDIPSFFRQNNLGVRDAVLLWNRIGYRSETQTGLPSVGHLELFELIERFQNIHRLSHYLSSTLSGLPAAKRNMASEQFSQMIEYIDKHYTAKLELGELCDRFFISPSYASALFQKEKQTTFSQYVTELRLKNACGLMRTYPQLSIAEIGEMVGYKDYFYFTKLFRKHIGCRPSDYKAKMETERSGLSERSAPVGAASCDRSKPEIKTENERNEKE